MPALARYASEFYRFIRPTSCPPASLRFNETTVATILGERARRRQRAAVTVFPMRAFLCVYGPVCCKGTHTAGTRARDAFISARVQFGAWIIKAR